MKKSICLIVAALMVFALLPIGVSAAKDTVIETITIKGVTKPVAHEYPDMDVEPVGDGVTAGYTIEYALWYDETNYQLSYNEEFELGMRYFVYFDLVPEDGYTFKNNATVILQDENGVTIPKEEYEGEHEFISQSPYNYIYSGYFTAEMNELSSVTLNGYTDPEIGTTVGEYTMPSLAAGSHCSVTSAEWQRNGETCGSNTVFSGSEGFKLMLTLTADQGYGFGPSAEDTSLNVGTAVSVSEDRKSITVEIVPNIDSIAVLDLSLFYPAMWPAEGAAGVPGLTEKSDFYSITEQTWFYNDAPLSEGEEFISGHEYSLSADIAVENGFHLAESYVVKVNGAVIEEGTAPQNSNEITITIGSIGCKLGDVDGNGVVDTTDALFVLRWALGIDATFACDADHNGSIDTTDALLVLRAALNINSFAENWYRIIFYGENGEELQNSLVEEGKRPLFGDEDPVKIGDAQYTYRFTGWASEPGQEQGISGSELPEAAEDACYYAAFTGSLNNYSEFTGDTVSTDDFYMICGIESYKLYALTIGESNAESINVINGEVFPSDTNMIWSFVPVKDDEGHDAPAYHIKNYSDESIFTIEDGKAEFTVEKAKDDTWALVLTGSAADPEVTEPPAPVETEEPVGTGKTVTVLGFNGTGFVFQTVDADLSGYSGLYLFAWHAPRIAPMAALKAGGPPRMTLLG